MRSIPKSLLLLGPLLFLLLFVYLLPFAGIVRWSVTRPEFGFDHYATVFNDPLIISVFWRTLRICTLVTIASVVAGYAVALVWVRGGPVARLFVEFCIIVPFWISVLTRAFGWLALLSNRGLINGWLQSLGLIDEPLLLVRNEIGVVIGMVHFLIPFAVFPLATAMRNMDERALMAARGMGAGRVRIFWQIFLPMTAPGVMGAALLVFVFSIGFFVTPAILGGGRSVMVAELIYLRIFQSPDWGLAAAISVTLMMAIAVLLALLLRQVQPEKSG